MNAEASVFAENAPTPAADLVERYSEEGGLVQRSIALRSGGTGRSHVPKVNLGEGFTLAEIFDHSWLRHETCSVTETDRPDYIRIVDLFAGCGGMSLGISEAIRAIGKVPLHVLANEIEQEYLSVYARNFDPSISSAASVVDHFPGNLGSSLSTEEASLKAEVGTVDILLAGPPCQGHSDLNNYTRRSDPKNGLYLRAIRAAEVLEPANVIIENVPGVRHDRGNVLQIARDQLERLGYHTIITDINCADFGVAQSRKRTFLIASLNLRANSQDLSKHLEAMKVRRRPVSWAIGDLLNTSSDSVMDRTSALSPVSRSRIEWLFQNDLFDLPDDLRPDCHKNKQHSYKSVYGRMFWDRPAQTITTGYQVMGQGRYVHPKRQRVITPHEAARLQFLPDYFDFGSPNRKTIAKMIGNAVPPKMAYVLGLFLLR